MDLHVSEVTGPSSGGCAQILFGVITCVGCVLTACRLRWDLYAVNTSYAIITPNSICAESPEMSD
jgi:hypothetical protein